ncbi:hypothetical protein GA0074692_2707 [Micromonospora pallida]|uniref:Uncharacterized protein n=1 Tax=Micromonospora pallida TaxID=145854 RepID=A0A1C6SIZ4_9ACTN|nr:hypothetical protein [Micromonospora pallida]SCL29335.1 hypothetical protein GA0074692_2707 [Micromonospora pallida]
MANTATFEDALASILGLVLGGGEGGEKASINDNFRPRTIKGPGYWLITQTSTLKSNVIGGWMPEYNKDAVTFYRWKQKGVYKHITRVTVWVGVTSRDDTQGQERNTTDPGNSTNPDGNPVVALGNAWERMIADLPKVAGPNKAFDPDSIGSVREILANLTTHALGISSELTDQVKSVNAKSPDFKGSAESAWRHRVQEANKYLADIMPQAKQWDTSLAQVEQAMRDFITAVADTFEKWSSIHPAGIWQHPYRVIAQMFNESTLEYGDLHDGQSNAWDLGQQYAETGDEEGSQYRGTKFGGSDAGIVTWTPPAWVKYHPFDAFSIPEWNKLDQHLRQMWADNALKTFEPAILAAKKLVSVFAEARNPMSITDPKPVPPNPMPNDVGMPNGGFANNPFGNMGNPFANWGDPFANMGNPFANVGNPFANMGNPFANVGNPFANVGNPFANVGANFGNQFPNGGGLGNPFANGGGLGNPFANGTGGGAFMPASMMPNSGAGGGAGNPFANGLGGSFGGGAENPFGGGVGGGLPTDLKVKSGMPSEGGGAGNPFANGLGGSFGGGAGGDLPASLMPNSGAGGGAGNPFANGLDGSFGGGAENPFGGGAGGGLPTDLKVKSGMPSEGGGAGNPFANGGLDAVVGGGGASGLPPIPAPKPVTPSAGGGLENPFTGGGAGSSLPTSNLGLNRKPSGPQSLGDLTPSQLEQLDKAGLLDDVPLTAEQADYLRKNGLSPGGATNLGQLSPDQLDALDRGGLLDETPLTNDQRAKLGLNGPQSLGDLTPSQLQRLDGAGLLDDAPLTAEQADYLRKNGLSPGGATNLGQLNPDQLDALQRGGLLDDVPLSPEERAKLGLPPNPSGSSGGGGSVPGLNTGKLPWPDTGGGGSVPGLNTGKLPWPDTGPSAPIDRNAFPTTVDGKDVSPKPGMTGSITAPPALGDVTRPGSASFPHVPGVQVGTGGLSAVPGVSGSPGALNPDKLGVPVGGPVGANLTPGPGAGPGLPQPGAGGMPGGGMPFMPPMMPGMGGAPQQGQDRDRQRSTWLKEDEKVWGTDPDCAPAVIGRRGRDTRVEDDEFGMPVDDRPGSQDERRRYRGR